MERRTLDEMMYRLSQKIDDMGRQYKQELMGMVIAIEHEAKRQTEPDESKKLRILADALDGVPCFLPCQKLFAPEGWCKEHCHTDEPTAECWLKYVEVMVDG